MEKEITFGIDIDEVIRAIVPNMLKLYNKEFNDNMKLEDVKDYVVDNSFPKIMERTGESASKWFFQDHGNELFYGSEMIEGAKSAIDMLRTYGKVIIISYQKSLANKIDTLNWLDRYDIKYDGICFVKDKSIVHTDFLVDDNDWNFIGCNSKWGVIVTAPYNKEINTDELKAKSNCEDIFRFGSLREFAYSYACAALVATCNQINGIGK